MSDPEVVCGEKCPVCDGELMAEPTDRGWPDGEYVFCARNCGCHGVIKHDDNGLVYVEICEGILTVLEQLKEARALAEEERRFKYVAEANAARLTRLLDETLDARDAYKGRCRAATQRIIESIGAQGPENIEEAVERLLGMTKRQSSASRELPGDLVQPCGPNDGIPFEPWVTVSTLEAYGITFKGRKS